MTGPIAAAAAVPADSSGDVRRLQPVRSAARLSLVVAVVAIGLGLVAPTVVDHQQLVILVIGFLVGLPHGAVDHLVPFWTGWVRRDATMTVMVLLGYVGVAVVTWVGLHWAAPVVLPVLLVVSVLHFGAGDLMAARDDRQLTDRRGLPGLPALLAQVTARGGPVVAGPLLCWPHQAGQALASIQLGFAMPALSVRVVLAAVVAVCVLGSVGAALRVGDLRSAAEVVVLAAVFTALPPLAAFGVYFGAWHGLRHTARLISRDPRNHADLAVGRLRRPVRRFLVSAAFPTLVAAGSAAALVLLAGRHADLTGTLFTVLLALTVPHLVVVAVLDLAALDVVRLGGRQ